METRLDKKGWEIIREVTDWWKREKLRMEGLDGM